MESRHHDVTVRRWYVRRVCHKKGGLSLLGCCEEAAVVHLTEARERHRVISIFTPYFGKNQEGSVDLWELLVPPLKQLWHMIALLQPVFCCAIPGNRRGSLIDLKAVHSSLEPRA